MDKHEVYKTINVLVLASMAGFLLSRSSVFLLFAAGLLISNLVYFRLSRVIAFWWLKFSRFLGRINSAVLLTLVFFLLLTPIGFLYRLYNPLRSDHFKRNNRESWFDKVEGHYSETSFLKQW